LLAGLPDFSWSKYTYQNGKTMTMNDIKMIPNGHKIFQHFTQIWIFGLKIYHLATLVAG
jgi:hypothetical protein